MERVRPDIIGTVQQELDISQRNLSAAAGYIMALL